MERSHEYHQQSAIFCDVARYRNNAGRSDFLSEISGMCTRKPDLENCHNVTLFSTAQAAFYRRDLRVLKTVEIGRAFCALPIADGIS